MSASSASVRSGPTMFPIVCDLRTSLLLDGGVREHVAALRPFVPLRRQFHHLVRLLRGVVVHRHRVCLKIVQLPGCTSLRHQLPLPASDRPVALVLPCQVLAVERFAGECRDETLSLHRRDGPVAPFHRVGRASNVHACRHYVDDMADLIAELPLGGDAVWPLSDHRRADATLVAVVLVHPEGRATGVRPPAAVAVVCPWPAHSGELVTLMENIFRPAAPVEPKRVPFGARSVVAEEEYECVVEFPILLQ